MLVFAGIIVFLFGFRILRELYKAGENNSDFSKTDLKYNVVGLVVALAGWLALFITII